MNSNKPLWRTAPDWADFLCQDQNSRWYWFEFRPKEAMGQFVVVKGRWKIALPEQWAKIIEERVK